MDGLSDGPKSAPAPVSPRSRSSSKVRFAEDTDDYEIRSNPSTSSRSVPERWGGMDIPDAEKDAGKEILYQITQQAFNELLDIVFRAKEDLAIRCAETKALRDKHRALFASLDLDAEDGLQAAARAASENPDPQTQTLSELLLRSGYTVDESLRFHATPTSEGSDPVRHDISDPDEDMLPAASEMPSADALEHRDPTMPQFRPTSLPEGVPRHRRQDDASSPDESERPADDESKAPANDENKRPAWANGTGSTPTSSSPDRKDPLRQSRSIR